MKNFKYLLFLFGLIGMMAFSCRKDENTECEEEPQPVEIIELQKVGSDTIFELQNVANDSQIDNLIINSQVDYEKYIYSNHPLPFIDFTAYTLLAGRMGTPSTDFFDSQNVYIACNELTYTVYIARGPSQAPSIVYYFAIIPKTDVHIVFNIIYPYPF